MIKALVLAFMAFLLNQSEQTLRNKAILLSIMGHALNTEALGIDTGEFPVRRIVKSGDEEESAIAASLALRETASKSILRRVRENCPSSWTFWPSPFLLNPICEHRLEVNRVIDWDYLLKHLNICGWGRSVVVEDVVPPNKDFIVFVTNIGGAKINSIKPRPVFGFHNLVGLNSGLRRINGGSVGFVSRDQSEDKHDGRGNSEKCHDPLCKRIARANKRPEKPVPISSYLTVIAFLAAFGAGFACLLRLIVEPKK